MSILDLVWLVAPPLCWECGDAVRDGGRICSRCRSRLRWLEATPSHGGGVLSWAPLAYAGAARALVRGLKFQRAAGLADELAAPMVAGAPDGWLRPPATAGEPWRPPVLVPVPLHPARGRRRGFNQAERLAAALARRTGLPVADCLRRAGSSATQVGRGREQRLAGLAGRVLLAHPAPARALIVDDVITTGATLSACAGALRAGGGEPIGAIAYARTPGR